MTMGRFKSKCASCSKGSWVVCACVCVCVCVCLCVVSSEDEDEDMLFEYHIGSDTESGDNEQVGTGWSVIAGWMMEEKSKGK